MLAGQASPPLSCGQELVIGNGVIQMKTADTAHTGIGQGLGNKAISLATQN